MEVLDINNVNHETAIFTIDVVIPVCNCERYIVKALASVASQTYKPSKIIVVDDGSTDTSPELINNFSSSIQVEYVRKLNGGLSSARNAGIAYCTSDYIAFLDADDEWYPEKLSEQLKIFCESELADLGVVYCSYEIIDSIGNIADDYFVLDIDSSIRGEVFKHLTYGNKIAGSSSSVLVKRECFEKLGGFDESLTANEDWDMWLRIAEKYSFDFTSETLVKIRRHPHNMQKDIMLMFQNQLVFQEKWCSRVCADKKCISEWRDSIIWQLCRHRSFKLVRVATKILSTKSRLHLFKSTFGSIWLYLICYVIIESLKGIVSYLSKVKKLCEHIYRVT